MRRHVIYREKVESMGDSSRTRKEIAKELPVCEECATKLAAAVLALKGR
jgi:hypothetical protein